MKQVDLENNKLERYVVIDGCPKCGSPRTLLRPNAEGECADCGLRVSWDAFNDITVENPDPNVRALFKLIDFLDEQKLVIDEVTLGVEHDYKYDKRMRKDIITDIRANLQLKVKPRKDDEDFEKLH